MRRTAQRRRSLLSILYYYSRPGHSVSVVGGLVTGGIECRGAVPAQAVGVLPGIPDQATQASRRSAVLLGAVVSTIQLETGIGDRQTGDPNRLASPGVQAILAGFFLTFMYACGLWL